MTKEGRGVIRIKRDLQLDSLMLASYTVSSVTLFNQPTSQPVIQPFVGVSLPASNDDESGIKLVK